MAKERLDYMSSAIAAAQKPRRWFLQWATLSIFLLGILVLHSQHHNILPTWSYEPQPPPQASKIFSWSDIEPSRHLEYTPCFGHFQCARLEVPLNWNSSNSDGPTAAVAIIRLPAKVPVTDPQYGGAVVLNPGGPGESGIHQVLTGGSYIQTILDSPTSPTPTSNSTARFFDIVSFDPRGVNNTTPRLKCYPNAYDQQNWILKLPDYGLLWDSEAVLGLEWARAEAQGKSCSQGDPENDMIRFVNTAQVVEDMVAIIEQHGEWREKEAAKELATIPRISSADRETALSRTRWKVGEEMLQYWGVSYGTLLGATFAAMHPERVQRMVLDGNLNPEDYYSGARLKNLHDSDMIITKFCEYCFLAGPDACPLYTGTSVSDVEARLTRIMLDLRSNPIPVLRENGGPEVVLYGDMHLFGLLTAMYFPSTAEHFFSLLSDAERGNASWVAEIKQAWFRPMEVSQRCLEDGAFSEACISGKDYLAGFGPEQSIACMDQGGRGNFTKDDFWRYWEEVQDQSRWISRSWARGRIACVGYTVEPGWRFEGPYGGETAYPILLIGNSHDTVTPLANAYHNAAAFPGAVVLQQDSQGHCSYSMPSLCTGKLLRSYFQTGALPEVGTICQPDYKPFIGCMNKEMGEDGISKCKEMTNEEALMWAAWVGLTAVWP